MKKLFILMITTLTAIQLTSCSNEQNTTAGNDGRVNFVTGDVKAFINNETLSLNSGDKITGGMTVKTGSKSIVEIQFNGSIIRINERSSLLMRELIKNVKDNSEHTDIYVENGQAIFKVTRKLTSTEKFNVNTPTSVAGVRGTEFIVTSEKEKSIIACMEGKVAVKKSSSDDSEFVNVNSGKEAVIENGKPVSIKNIDNSKQKKNNINTTDKADESIEPIKVPKKIRAQSIKGDIEAGK